MKERFAEQLPEKIEQIKKLRKEHGNKVIGEVTLDQVYGGARGIKVNIDIVRETLRACTDQFYSPLFGRDPSWMLRRVSVSAD